MQILSDLFRDYLEAAELLEPERDAKFMTRVREARSRLVPPRIGKDGTLQEWTEDFEQLEDKHRHFSHLYGLYPGNVISAKNTPQFIDACKAVLEQRGDGGTGFSRGWKMALWARLYDGNRAGRIFKGYIQEQCYPQLFAKCYTPLQMDGTQGVAAGITEMLIQSHEGVIDLLPALPDDWGKGSFQGVCARGGFELDISWDNGTITRAEVLSKYGLPCRINPGSEVRVEKNGKRIRPKTHEDGSVSFGTEAGGVYTLVKRI
jgi:alpha-L-fucosidase 2